MKTGPLATLGALAGSAAGLRRLLASGVLTVDLGVGRTARPLGPIVVSIGAPRDLVFDVVSSPYLGRTPRALEKKLKVLERGVDMVLAAHFTQTRGFVTTSASSERISGRWDGGGEQRSRVAWKRLSGPRSKGSRSRRSDERRGTGPRLVALVLRCSLDLSER